MATHMIRLFIEPPKGDAENAVDQWIQNHNEWTDDPVDHTLVETNAEIDGSGTTYVRGDYRFLQDTSKTSVLDDLENNLQSIEGGLWYRIGYHECAYDEENGGPCSWGDTRENGTVPNDIPNFN